MDMVALVKQFFKPLDTHKKSKFIIISKKI